MNINDKSQFRECTSCQVCGAVCPVGAIFFKFNENGFYRPEIDANKCIDCGLCVKSCYKFDKQIFQSDLTKKQIYAAWTENQEILKATTSGGVADILAEELIEKGYRCIGVTYDTKTNRALGKIAHDRTEILGFRGSKYIQAYTFDAFKELVKTCKEQKYAVFGLPCQIYAIDKYLTNRNTRDNHLLIDMYCHGCPSIYAWDKYLDQVIKRVNGKSVLSVNFRSKIRGWGNFYVVVVVVEGVKHPIEVVSPRVNDSFYELFFSDCVLNDSCGDCLLRSTLEYCDIRLGDFWGKSYVSNHKGVSGVTISTSRGKQFFDEISNVLHREPQKFSNFIPYQSYGKKYNLNKSTRDKLFSLLSNPNTSMDECVKAYHKSMSLKTRFKHKLKNIVKLLPNTIVSAIKVGMYSIKH